MPAAPPAIRGVGGEAFWYENGIAIGLVRGALGDNDSGLSTGQASQEVMFISRAAVKNEIYGAAGEPTAAAIAVRKLIELLRFVFYAGGRG